MKNVGIIGLGLIGGSFAKAVKASGKYTVFGCDKDVKTENAAIKDKAIDFVLTEENAKDIDLLVSAVTVGVFKDATERFLPFLKGGATVIDFGGVKRRQVATMEKWKKDFPALKFFGGHPMAGKERYGYVNSDGELFKNAFMIIVPTADKISEDLKTVFYDAGFGRITETDANTHDEIIAYTSQLCHIVSSAFVKNGTAMRSAGFSAGSLKDLTRVARLSPDAWTELILSNRENVLSELDEFIGNLKKYRNAVNNGDKDGLSVLFAEGNLLKEKLDGEK